MSEIKNNKPSPYRLKLWFAYTGEEKSYVIYRGYETGIINSAEVQPFLRTARFNHASNILFPFLAFPLMKLAVFDRLKSKILLTHQPNYLYGLTGAVLCASWLLWVNWSPLYRSFENKREDLLELLFKRIGPSMRHLNDVLPRFWNEGEISRKMRKLYNERNGLLTGYIYPYEDFAEPLINKADFAPIKPNKIYR